jgi:hypothetical protein
MHRFLVLGNQMFYYRHQFAHNLRSISSSDLIIRRNERNSEEIRTEMSEKMHQGKLSEEMRKLCDCEL